MDFEWDPAKAAANLAKHGVRFETATEVFDDPAVLLEDDPFSTDEYRETAIGASQCGLLVVVFTERRGSVIRIISARLAVANERRRYRALR